MILTCNVCGYDYDGRQGQKCPKCVETIKRETVTRPSQVKRETRQEPLLFDPRKSNG